MSCSQVMTYAVVWLAIVATLQAALIVYVIFNWRTVLDRLAGILLDRWLDGEGLDGPLYK